MTTISEFVARAEKYARESGQSLSTLSRKLLNDGKGLSRLKDGGQCTLKTLETAQAKLEALESDVKVGRVNMTHLELSLIHI